MTHAQNPALKHELTIGGASIYTLKNVTDYHLSRHIEATRQAMYCSAGANPEVITAHADAIIERCNKAIATDTFKTDCAGIANALKFRCSKPVDQWSGIRMGCVLAFMETEQATEALDSCDIFWLQKKEELARNHPEAFTFFLTWGAVNVPSWSQHLDSLSDQDYLRSRMETIASMLPSDLFNLSRL